MLGVLFFAGAAGAALEVVVEVGRYVARQAPGGLGSRYVLGGYLAGIAVDVRHRPTDLSSPGGGPPAVTRRSRPVRFAS